MKKIKFRAWNKETNQYELPLYRGVANLNINDILQGSTLIYQQFTGLLDKNGKEIYEGDIVKLEYHGISDVYWNGGYRIHGKMSAISFGKSNASYCEIIGNIYEHPNLLN